MTYQIGETGTVTLEGRTFELEFNPHHGGRTYGECEVDCPQGWKIPEYMLLQNVRNSPDRDRFNLLGTWEYVQNPDKISKDKGYVARFSADSSRVSLSCIRGPAVRDPLLGVRYVREIPQPTEWEAAKAIGERTIVPEYHGD